MNPTHVGVLQQVKRHVANTPDQVMFVELLGLLQNGLATHANRVWMARCARMSMGESVWNRTFCGEEIMSLFATKKEAFEHNISIMKTLERPFVMIKALTSGPGAVNISADEAEKFIPDYLSLHWKKYDACCKYVARSRPV